MVKAGPATDITAALVVRSADGRTEPDQDVSRKPSGPATIVEGARPLRRRSLGFIGRHGSSAARAHQLRCPVSRSLVLRSPASSSIRSTSSVASAVSMLPSRS